MVVKIGLDLGYANITLSDPTAGISRESSIALVDKATNRILALGDAALSGIDGVSGVLVRPFKNGMLYSSDLTRAILTNAMEAFGEDADIRCLIALPSDMLPKQEKELFSMADEAGATAVYGVKRAMAALIGAGAEPTDSLISVNIGASKTDIIVLCEGEILLSACAPIGGEDFDVAVQEYILAQGDVRVSLSVAKAIKEKLGAVWPGKDAESIDIEGTLSLTGNRIHMNIATEDILGVFETPLQRILMAIAEQVKRIPMECVERVFQKGILLSGGGSLLFGLNHMIERVLDVPVMQAQDPMNCVAKGLARIHSFLPSKMRTNQKNITAQLARLYEEKNKKS